MNNQEIQYWFVGAKWDGKEKTSDFVKNGVWINGYNNKYTKQVNSIKVGDRIAIKASYTKKNNLPFENPKNNLVSVLKIKAVGLVTNNAKDGQNINVDWDKSFKEKEWYFYTSRNTIWKPNTDNWQGKALIDFTFSGIEQDFDKFRNDPTRIERYGNISPNSEKYIWTSFYQEFADKLLEYKNNRTPLIEEIHNISKNIEAMAPLNDHFKNGITGKLQDICPFTVFALFNRQITINNRIKIAKALANFLQVETEVPTSFDAIPVVNNQSTWFFSYENLRESDDIDILWEMFDQAIQLTNKQIEENEAFIELYDKSNKIRGIKWNLTIGLFWIRPWDYVPLDQNTRDFINKNISNYLKFNEIKKILDGEEYLKLCDELTNYFENNSQSINSYPDLSYIAWEKDPNKKQSIDSDSNINKEVKNKLCPKNIILYGPPGTGKTYNTVNETLNLIYDKEIIFQSRQEKKEIFQELVTKGQVVFTTFHQSLSYEDFIEGIKPEIMDKTVVYKVVDGIFKEIAIQANKNWVKSKGENDCSFEAIWTIFVEQFENNENAPITINSFRSKFKIYDINENTIRFEKSSGTKNHTLCINTLKKFYNNPSLIDNIGGLKTYYKGLVNKLNEIKTEYEPSTSTINEELKQYVLIIDEINRGNVASIFGELITLLEPDKRDGMPEKISTKLPYSKDDFTVPPNLHIIGTMNTADRSIESLDIALRRRFLFKEIMPDTKLFNEKEFQDLNLNYNLSKMLETINNRIIRLKDRDHVIGHSYFFSLLNCEDIEEELINIFKNKIIPLLEEYFFGDWEKIGMILGESFISASPIKISFAKGFEGDDEESDKIYTLKNSKEWDFKAIYE